MNVYIIEVFDETKNTFVFWNAVKNYDIGEEMIYKTLAEKDEFIKRPKLEINTEQDYHIFRGVYTTVGSYYNDPLCINCIKECIFRGHYITI